MIIRLLIAALALTGLTALAEKNECKNCGSDTTHCNVYRCNKCRKFFCARCREGDGKLEGGHPVAAMLDSMMANVKDQAGNLVIICPECGAKDHLWYGRPQEGNVRLIRSGE